MAISYIALGTNNLAAARVYYDTVLRILGAELEIDRPGFTCCCRMRDGVKISVGHAQNGEAATFGNGTMIGPLARSEAEVVVAYKVALEHGGRSEGAPGPRPLYGPEFYGAYARDPEGNKMSFVHYRSGKELNDGR